MFDQLASFGFAWENRSSGEEFSEDAADGPHIYLVSVVTASQNQFWSSIVSRNDVRCVEAVRAQYFGTAKVTYFNNTLLIHENVLRLQVSVTHSLLMSEVHTAKNLTHEVLNRIHRDQGPLLLSILNNLFKILVAKFKDKVLHHFALLVLRVVNIEKLNDIFAASKTIEHFEFA